MKNYEVKLDSGFSFAFDATELPTENDALEALESIVDTAQTNLSLGPQYITNKNTLSRRKKNKEDKKTFYTREASRYLTIPEDKFDYDNGAPIGLRNDMSYLRSLGAKSWYLSEKYGTENVRPISIRGTEEILYRDPEEGKWRFFDSMTLELADFTEMQSEVAPMAAGIGAGIATFLGASSVSTPIGGVVAGATASAAAEFAVGTAQDAIARQQMGIPEDIGDGFIKRRGQEAMMNFGLELALPVIGKIPFALRIGKGGTDIANKEVASVMNQLGIDPIRMQQGGIASMQRLADIAGKFPDSTAASFLADIRTQIQTRMSDQIGEGMSNEAIDTILRKSVQDIASQLGADEVVLRESLEKLSVQKAGVEAAQTSTVKRDAAKKARGVFQGEVNKRAKNIVGKDLNPETVGLTYKKKIINHYVTTEARVSNMYDQAYDLLRGVTMPNEVVANILNKQKNRAILDADDEVIATLAPSGRTASGRAVNTLEDILDEPMSFRQLNELIQQVRSKAGYGKADVNPNASVYRQLGKELEEQRDFVLGLGSTPEVGRTMFENANTAFRNEIQPLRENVIKKHIDAPKGQNYGEAIKLAKSGQPFDEALPNMEGYLIGGLELVKDALSTPAKTKAFLRSAGNTMEDRQLLRQMWLSDKGLVGGRDIPVSALRFSPEDRAMVETLWDKNVKGMNQRWDVLKRIEEFADTKDGFIEGLTNETFNEIMSESTNKTTQELFEIGKKEVLLSKQIQEVVDDGFLKLMAKGEVPLPTSSATMETFADEMIKMGNHTDFQKIVNRFRERADGSDKAFTLSVLQGLTRRAGRETDTAQINKFGEQMWNPKVMRTELKKNEVNLRELLGDDVYDNFVELNKGLDRVSATPQVKVKDGIDPRANVSGGGKVSMFFPNVYGAAKDRITKLMIWNQIKNPINFKKMVSPEDYRRLNEATVRSLFLAGQFPDLLMEADADPDFRLWLNETYGLISTAAQTQGVQQSRMPTMQNYSEQAMDQPQKGATPQQAAPSNFQQLTQ
jgi:hypothetical protein